jgi:hypothetical protein
MQQPDNKIAVRFLDFSGYFFNLVTASLNESIQQGNKNFIMAKPTDNIAEKYRAATSWSDFHILIPVLFNFFHGVELWLKGAHYLKNAADCKGGHRLSAWLDLFKANYPTKTDVATIFSSYIFPSDASSVLGEFYKTNNIKNSDQFYEILKYPFNKSLSISFDYKDTRNLGNKGIEFFKQIISDVNKIRAETATL